MRLALFLLGMLLGACTASTPAAPARSHLSDHIEGAAALQSKTVAILLDGGSICSGVWISPRSILTAKHCIANQDHGEPVIFATHEDLFPGLSLRAHTSIPLRVALVSAVDPSHDLALLFALRPPPHGVAELHDGGIEQGSFSQAMGHPMGLWFSYSSGYISSVREKDLGDGQSVWVQSTAPISPGNSGGGLFDSQARLVGVVVAIVDDGQNLNLFVHVSHVAAFLASQRAL
jgi:S1-C subfamily serine protease